MTGRVTELEKRVAKLVAAMDKVVAELERRRQASPELLKQWNTVRAEHGLTGNLEE